MTDERPDALIVRKCSCGAEYTLENMPDWCIGVRDGVPCRVGHFGGLARACADLKAVVAKLKEKKRDEF